MAKESYDVPGLPVDPIPAGKTVLVTGPGRLTSRLARELSFGGSHEDGIIFISTNTSGRILVTDTRQAYPELDFSRFGIIDATGRGDIESDTGAHIEAVSSTSDLTGISIKNSILTTKLRANGVQRVRTCFDSLSMLLLYTNFQTITRFVHTMDGRIAATDGLGVFALDPSMHDPQVKYTLQNVCDGVIEVRHGETGPEILVDGFGAYGSEWQSVEL